VLATLFVLIADDELAPEVPPPVTSASGSGVLERLPTLQQ
jgi:hypothetical protein